MTDASEALARINPGRLERFLQELANLKTLEPGSNKHNYPGARRLLRLYRDFFPLTFPQQSALSRLGDESHSELDRAGILIEPRTDEEREEESLHHLFDLSYRLRTAWDEPDKRRKEWFVFEIRRGEHHGLNPNVQGPPDDTLFERAMVHFQDIASRAKHCTNPGCLSPYFIADKRSYKYCSEECALPAQKAFKREWWAEHGADWRQRREKIAKKKGAKKHAKR
jgi:hypothetical protein